MAKIGDLRLSDNTGEEYTFEVYPAEDNFPSDAGVYMFTKRDSNRNHEILYIGETDSFKDRPLGWDIKNGGVLPEWDSLIYTCFRHPTEYLFKIGLLRHTNHH